MPPRTREGVGIELHRGHAGLDAVRSRWSALADGLPDQRCYQRPEWYGAYLAALEPDPESVIFALILRDGGAVGLLPLRRRRSFLHCPGIRVLELPWHGHMPVTDVVGAAALESALLPALQRAHREGVVRWDVLRARNIPRSSPLAAGVSRETEPRGWRAVLRTGFASHDLGLDDHATYMASLPSKFRANLRNSRRRLERAGAAPAFASAREGHELALAFEIFLRLESAGWKGVTGTGSAVALHPHLVRFYQELLRSFAAVGGAQVSVLRSGERPVAASLNIRAGGVLTGLKMGFDPLYASCSPGMLLLERLLGEAAADPDLHVFDFNGAAAWHGPWRPRLRPLVHVHICNDTPGGALAYRLLRGRTRLVPIYHGLRELITVGATERG